MKFLVTSLLFTFSSSLLALVDYSSSNSSSSNGVRKAPKRISRPAAPQSSQQSSTYRPSGWFSLNSNFESVDVQSSDPFKAKRFVFNGHFQTPYHLSLDVHYWMAQANDEAFGGDGSFYRGNPSVKVNLNWFTMGKAQEAASLDLFGKFQFSEDDPSNPFASTRNDKSFGVESIKRFYNVAFGLSYGVTLSGTPENITETHIGNIQKITAGLGWVVSNDIKFLVEASNIRIDKKESSKHPVTLSENIRYGVVSAVLSLGISPLVNFDLGAQVNTSGASPSDEALNARLWDLEGLYGTTLTAGLNIAL